MKRKLCPFLHRKKFKISQFNRRSHSGYNLEPPKCWISPLKVKKLAITYVVTHFHVKIEALWLPGNTSIHQNNLKSTWTWFLHWKDIWCKNSMFLENIEFLPSHKLIFLQFWGVSNVQKLENMYKLVSVFLIDNFPINLNFTSKFKF